MLSKIWLKIQVFNKFTSWDPKRCFYWGVPSVPRELMIKPIKMANFIKKKEKKL
jgi:hypothetical protein